MNTVIFLLILHLLCVIVTGAGFYLGILKVHRIMFVVVLFLPLWGFVAMLCIHFSALLNKDGEKDVDMEKLRLDSEIFKSVAVDTKKNSDRIVPLEEALIVNSAKQRRELIMDVLNDNPKEYIEFLQKAGNNDDTEVVHYAITAMVEISKENDFVLQKLDNEYKKNPDDTDVLSHYCDFLYGCLEQNLWQGQVEMMNRRTFDELITKKISGGGNLEDYIRFVKNVQKLGDFARASAALDKMESLFGNNEKIFLLRLRYYAQIQDGEKIKQLVKDAEDSHMYLSSEVKEEVAFWKE